MLLNAEIPVVIPSVTEHWKLWGTMAVSICVSYSGPLILDIVGDRIQKQVFLGSCATDLSCFVLAGKVIDAISREKKRKQLGLAWIVELMVQC